MTRKPNCIVRFSPDVAFRYCALFSVVLIVKFSWLKTLKASAITSIDTRFGSATALLDAEARAVASRLREVVARDNGAVGTQALALDRARAEDAKIAAIGGGRSIAGAGVVDAAQLEAVAHLPDAVQHHAVALIAFGKAPLAVQILRKLERHFNRHAAGDALERLPTAFKKPANV